MFKELEIKSRDSCAVCNWVEDCSECSDYGVDFNPHICKHWKWYLPIPFCLPQRIRWKRQVKNHEGKLLGNQE